MKITRLLVCLLFAALLAAACGGGNYLQIPRCEDITAPDELPAVSQAYQPVSAGCLAYLPPFDSAGWFESSMNSRRLRGEEVLRLGCTHCPAGNQDCGRIDNCGGCYTAQYYFDFTKIQEDAEIAAAYLAVYPLEGRDNLMLSELKGRLNMGQDFARLAGNPRFMNQWALYDVTSFACRAVAQRRNSVLFDLSVPCGLQNLTKLATVNLMEEAEPALIIEYK